MARINTHSRALCLSPALFSSPYVLIGKTFKKKKLSQASIAVNVEKKMCLRISTNAPEAS